jgi:hypothetical protein
LLDGDVSSLLASLAFGTSASLGFAIAGLATVSIGLAFSAGLGLSAANPCDITSTKAAAPITELAAKRFFIQ